MSEAQKDHSLNVRNEVKLHGSLAYALAADIKLTVEEG